MQVFMDNPDLEVQANRDTGEKTLAELSKEFLNKKALEPHRSRHAGDHDRVITEEFVQVAHRRCADEVTETGVLRYHRAMRQRGLSDRTASNQIGGLLALLRHC